MQRGGWNYTLLRQLWCEYTGWILYCMAIITPQCSLIWETLPNMESIGFRSCTSLLCLLFSDLSLASGCCVNNTISTTNPLIFTSLQRDLRIGTLQQYMNGKLLSCGRWYRDISFYLLEKTMCQLLIVHKWTCREQNPIALCW